MADTNQNEQDNAEYKEAYDIARSEDGGFDVTGAIERVFYTESPSAQAGREAGTNDRHEYGPRP